MVLKSFDAEVKVFVVVVNIESNLPKFFINLGGSIPLGSPFINDWKFLTPCFTPENVPEAVALSLSKNPSLTNS